MPKSRKTSTNSDAIRIRGARQHNLKNLDLDIPLGQVTVITGPSGSGKSSLAFHTLYAEGQRRYVETFSPYVRQFFARMDKPEVDRIDGIPPAIAVEQKNAIRTTRSTVGTLTEVNDYLKLLYPRLAVGHDPRTGKKIQPDSAQSIRAWAEDALTDQQITILFPLVVPADTTCEDVFPFLNQQGYLRVLLDGKPVRTDAPPADKTLSDTIWVIQDRLKITAKNRSRLTESLEQALTFGKGRTRLQHEPLSPGKADFSEFSTSWAPLREPTPALFSFNSALGACPSCRGFGRVIGIDLDRAIPDPRKTLKGGAIKPFEGERGQDSRRDLFRAAKEVGLDLNMPWQDLDPDQQHWVKYGERKKTSTLSSLEQSEALWNNKQWYGIQGFFDWAETKAYKMHVRVFLAKYRAYTLCPECQGTRLQPEALAFTIDGKTLPELWQLPLSSLARFIEKVEQNHGPFDTSTRLVHTEISNRLRYLEDVGLGYLTLDRPARTLSGGEIARTNLTTCLGSSLTHTLFVLDEPTVGLHARDIGRLNKVIRQLRDNNNTLVIVEHEEAVMHQADHLIDIGPTAGAEGGHITFQGPLPDFSRAVLQEKDALSPTLAYLQGQHTIPARETPRTATSFLKVRNASCHNLRSLDVDLPLEIFVCLTGVSGSGKSTLAHPVIYRNLARTFGLPLEEEPAPADLENVNLISGVELIDQSPLARTPRSTPAVLLGTFEHIRQLLAQSPAALTRNLTPGYFSFNSGPGRCQRCNGNGQEKVEMQFLSDLYLTCPECLGTRFTSEAKTFYYHGKNVTDFLNLTAREALDFFENLTPAKGKETTLRRKILSTLQPLIDTGLGYLTLGQPLNTLSGGEAQRLKLCQLLTQTKATGKDHQTHLLILDEPTTGLHFGDIAKLLEIFQRLTDQGYSLLVIEHQLDVIKNADYVLEIGPEAGHFGGELVFSGTPEELREAQTHTAEAIRHESQKEKSPPPKQLPTKSSNAIQLAGLRHHNLKNVSLEIPHNEFVVISGLSGSGKSTLAFDILFAEGQRRFLDSMSPYARQFASQLEKPDLDSISGLPPTVAIEQRISRGGRKSTVGTVTEIYHFFRLLFSKVGIQHCPDSGVPVVSQTPQAIEKQVRALLKEHKSLRILAPVLKARKGYHKEFAEAASKSGFSEMFIDGSLVLTDEFQPLKRHQAHDIDFVITHFENARPKVADLQEALEKALQLGKGTLRLLLPTGVLVPLSTARVSPSTGRSFEELDPHHFSFNSPRGWCPECRGYGEAVRTKIDYKNYQSEAEAELHEETEPVDPNDTVPCPVCQGDRLKDFARTVYLPGDEQQINSLPALGRQTIIELEKTISGVHLTGRDKTIARDILPEITQRLQFLQQVGLGYLQLDRSAVTLSGGESQRIRLASQLGSNLQGVLYILDEPTIGLHPRDNHALIRTLQALRDKGNSLILVEHDEDTIKAATHLIDLGPGAGINGGEVVFQARRSPKAKTFTPQKLAFATPGQKAFTKRDSPTLQALTHPLHHPSRERRPLPKPTARKGWLKLKGCHQNNLKDIDALIPLSCLTVLTGVSGSGKSSLMRGCLSYAAQTHNSAATKRAARGQKPLSKPTGPKPYQSAHGFDQIKALYEVDQSPIGKTSRSCPATYVKLFDHIRALYAQLPESRLRGYTSSRFSFNNKEGQCPNCKGNGLVRLDMDFLPTTWVDCESCHGARYNPATLEVFFNGKTIGDVLQMNIATAAEFFSAQPKLQKPLQLLADTGLGYLTLGQPSPTLSGGEAQRLKLVTQLIKGRPRPGGVVGPGDPRFDTNLYLIEEPTIGLHQQDVAKLIEVLHRLTDEGHTVVVIEHHMDLAAEADYIIDIGPEAGPHGGTITAQGPPEEVAHSITSATAPHLLQALSQK